MPLFWAAFSALAAFFGIGDAVQAPKPQNHRSTRSRGHRMNAADTAWIIVATASVLFMTLPGLALFYGGLVRARNVLSVFMHCYAIACLMSVLWFAFGYSIAFGEGTPYWGGLGKMFLSGIDSE